MIRILCRLFRPRLVLLNGFVALGGFLLDTAAPHRGGLLGTFCGVVLLASGGSALNQAMEADLDRLMARTRLRPLPNGDLSLAAVIVIGLLCTLTGSALLAALGGPVPALLGLGALAWYLALYTPLKRRTPLALIIGGVCGAAPPLIGWTMAGGNLADYRILLLAGLMFLWQIPHFWLFQRRCADDYRRAGIMLLDRAYSHRLPGLFGLWICALIAAALLLPLLGVVHGNLSLWYALFPLPLIAISLFSSESALFSYLNIFPIMMTLALMAQR